MVAGMHRDLGNARINERAFIGRASFQPGPNASGASQRPAWVRSRGVNRQFAPQAHKKAENSSTSKKQHLGLVQRFSSAQNQLQADISIKSLLAQSLLASLTFGTAFQVTHNNGLLPVYDVWAFQIGPFLESGLVPFLLAPIWLLYGYLYPLLDAAFADDATEEFNAKASSLSFTATTWALCAAQFIISDVMYLQNFPHWQIYVVMAAFTLALWATRDRTKTGVILGLLLAIGAPLAEAVIVSFGLWHYDRPDNPLGVCYWTGFCYASYAYGVGSFARWQVQRQRRLSAGRTSD